MEATTLLTIFHLLFLSFTPIGECASRGNFLPPAVLDVSGNVLIQGKDYELMTWPKVPPPIGVTHSNFPLRNRDRGCWVRHLIEVAGIPNPSLPVKFLPVEPLIGSKFILEDTLFYIEFISIASEACGGSVWLVDDNSDPVFGQRFVRVGDHVKDETTWFQFVRTHLFPEYMYNLQFYPGPNSSDCQYVGIFKDNIYGIERLALVDTPVIFAFRPKDRSNSPYIEMKF